ncbi:MAG: flavodoxin domain-containing protein [Chloroflexota bacterium]
MNARVLIAYASRTGSTAEVAKAVGQEMRAAGWQTDVLPVEGVRDITGYDALILGTAIRIGKPLSEAMRFARQHQGDMATRPVAYFMLCDTLHEDTPHSREVAQDYLTPLRKIRQPVSEGLFGGVKDFSTAHPLLRWFAMRVLRLAEGDWRNWDEIRAWAAALPDKLAMAGPSVPASPCEPPVAVTASV